VAAAVAAAATHSHKSDITATNMGCKRGDDDDVVDDDDDADDDDDDDDAAAADDDDDDDDDDDAGKCRKGQAAHKQKHRALRQKRRYC
jgi:hypothetical protein